MPNSVPTRAFVAMFCGAAGLFLLLIAAGLINDGGGERPAPDFVVALCGIALLVAGCMAYAGTQSKLNDLLAAILCLIFGLVAAWIALFSPAEGFSGGFPFVSQALNLKISRWVFGGSAIVCFAIGMWAFKRFVQGSRTGA
ncbi:MAG: hypothetical protein WBN23_08350 [Woeseia sp.]